MYYKELIFKIEKNYSIKTVHAFLIYIYMLIFITQKLVGIFLFVNNIYLYTSRTLIYKLQFFELIITKDMQYLESDKYH